MPTDAVGMKSVNVKFSEVIDMSMSDINRMNEKQREMTIVDKELMELEALEYHLSHNPLVYGEDLQLVQKRYLELKKYYEST